MGSTPTGGIVPEPFVLGEDMLNEVVETLSKTPTADPDSPERVDVYNVDRRSDFNIERTDKRLSQCYVLRSCGACSDKDDVPPVVF